MKRCAFLSADSLVGHVVDDGLAVPHLERAGWRVDTVSWRTADAPWRDYDLVVVRSTWDYHRSPAAFLAVLEEIAGATRLRNPLATLRWNLDKRYLGELAAGGVPIVPTRYVESPSADDLLAACEAFGASAVVAKPSVGASADGLRRLARGDRAGAGEAAAALRGSVALIQPYLDRIESDGEVSLFYFGGTFSHAIRKVPEPGDFRVQEEHGGRLMRVEAERPLRALGRAALDAAPGDGPPLYARVDLVRVDDGYALMELELIEPALYLRMDPGAPAAFARAVAGAAPAGG